MGACKRRTATAREAGQNLFIKSKTKGIHSISSEAVLCMILIKKNPFFSCSYTGAAYKMDAFFFFFFLDDVHDWMVHRFAATVACGGSTGSLQLISPPVSGAERWTRLRRPVYPVSAPLRHACRGFLASTAGECSPDESCFTTRPLLSFSLSSHRKSREEIEADIEGRRSDTVI